MKISLHLKVWYLSNSEKRGKEKRREERRRVTNKGTNSEKGVFMNSDF